MVDRSRGLKIVLLILSFLGLLVVSPGQLSSQDPGAAKEQLILKVQGRAEKDVDQDRPGSSISDLALLFGEEAKAVGMPAADMLEVYEAAYQKARNDKPWWEKLEPGPGWFITLILAVFAILWGLFQKTLERFFEWLGSSLYSLITRFRLFWWLAERRYRQALVRSYQDLKIPFGTGRTLPMAEVFVPLKANEAGSTAIVDAQIALTKHRRLVVVGDPGAGKTMLMRHLCLTFAREGLRDFQGGPVPLLVELHRLSEKGQDLTQHMAQALELMDFPHATGFISSKLRQGNLLLLFDGLDEVNLKVRNQAVSQIKDLIQMAPDCRVVITCRTAVYNDEFAGWSDQNLKVVDFDDRQIQRFLNSWTTQMPPGKSIEHLLTSLSERPRILALARNPLLLTIITYLYCDTPFVLPHSRTEFYRNLTNILLDQWDRLHQRQNLFRASHKQLVLQALALFFQVRQGLVQQDRRSAPLQDVLRVLKDVFPSLNIEPQEAEPMLEEIAARSGLLLAIDRGKRFQFSHLTVQEFFAAIEMETRAHDLIKAFSKDPGLWRETVKFWCGLDHDSTDFIQEVALQDALTALECLGDSQEINEEYASSLINTFQARLGKEGADSEAVRRALAVVAADFRPRGLRLREALLTSLADPETLPQVRKAVAQVLSHTNLPQVAEILTAKAIVNSDLRTHVAEMGDLAVSPLAKLASTGDSVADWTIEALNAIGTAKATSALAALLWSGVSKVERRAAWHLATLLPRPEVEAALRLLPLSPERKRTESLDWVWEPFEPNPASPLRIVVGRIAMLIESTPEVEIPSQILEIDHRLSIAFCAVVAQEVQLQMIPPGRRKTLLFEFNDRFARTTSRHGDMAAFAPDEFARKLYPHPLWQYIFVNMQPMQKYRVLQLVLEHVAPRPSKSDWRISHLPSSYEFAGSVQLVGLLVSLLALLFIGSWSLNLEAYHAKTNGPPWSNILFCVGLLGFSRLTFRIGFQLEPAARARDPLVITAFLIEGLAAPGATTILILSGSSAWWAGLVICSSAALATTILLRNELSTGKPVNPLRPVTSIATTIVLVAVIGVLSWILVPSPPSSFLTLAGWLRALSACFLIGLCTLGISSVLKAGLADSHTTLDGTLFACFSSCLLLPVIFFPSLGVFGTSGWLGLSIFWIVWLLAFGGFNFVAARKHRRARNPFRFLHGASSERGLQ